MGRGKEKTVRCDKCGRETRKDKAVFIEKMTFSNPVDRKEVMEGNGYNRGTMREMCYCPSCGKHLRIYDKKIQQKVREKERSENSQSFGYGNRQGGYGGYNNNRPTNSQPNQSQPTTSPSEQTQN